MDLSERYQKHLDQVSRSFAFCIRQLKEPLKHQVGLSYLLCRILDTIEDTHFESAELRFFCMDEFDAFILGEPLEPRIDAWLGKMSHHTVPGEKALLADSFIIFKDLHGLPIREKKILQETILSMSRGMRYFLIHLSGPAGLDLKSLSDVNRYCFFVAGVVGELLTRLLGTHNPQFVVNEAKILEAHQFGIFLQKINLLKDKFEDQKVGRFLVPSEDELWRSLEFDLTGALDYLLGIPVEEREFRLFCAWSLFLGLASIPWIMRSGIAGILEKIPRSITEKILGRVTDAIDDRDELQKIFEQMKPSPRGAALTPVHLEKEFPRFSSLYHGKISQDHLRRLQMIG